MDCRAQAPQEPARRDSPAECGHGQDPQPPPAPQGRPSLSLGPAFARTARHFFPDFNAWLDEIKGPRCQRRVTYTSRFLLWCGLLLFVGKLGSRRQFDFKYREKGTSVLDNLNGLAQAE